jgi:hypothetical protein
MPDPFFSLTEMEICDLYNRLLPFTQVGDEVRKQHTLHVQIHKRDKA